MTTAPSPGMPYRLFMGAVGVIMLGWAVAYGYANYQSDQCIKSAQARIEGLSARLGTAAKPGPK